MKRVGAIVLAAGASRRLGQPKQLVGLQGEALLSRALRLAKEAGAQPVIPVLGAQFAKICASIHFDTSIPVFNERWEEGVASSIQAGLHEMDVRAPETDAVLILACDQPRLTSAHLHALIAAYQQQREDAIAASTYAGIRGAPAVFPRRVFEALYALAGDQGARVLLAKPPCAVVELQLAGGELDVDLPDDLKKLGRE